MTLENEKLENSNVGSILGETFRLEGNAEILQVCFYTHFTLFIRSIFTSYFSVPPQIEHDDDGLTARPNSVVSGLNNISSIHHHQRDIQTSSRPERISGLGTIDEKAGTYSNTYWMSERLSNTVYENVCKLLASFISVFRHIEDEPH